MDLNDYQKAALTTAVYPGAGTSAAMVYTALKLAGEAGEFSEHVGKAIRDDNFLVDTHDLTEEREALMLKELGDVMWYIAAAAHEMGYTLSEVAECNIAKLEDRRKRNALRGSGDTR